MTYADSTTIITRIGSLYKDETQNNSTGQVTDDLINTAISTADTIINSKLEDEGLTPPNTAPDSLKEAGNLLVVADILDTYYESTEGDRSPTAKINETKAYDLIQKYINKQSSNTSSPNHYSVEQSPMGDNLRDILDS